MRFSTITSSFPEGAQGRNNNIEVTYRGTTTNATPTELFIDALANKRLVPDKSSGIFLTCRVAYYTASTNTMRNRMFFVMATCNAAGVVSVVDADFGTTGTQTSINVAHANDAGAAVVQNQGISTQALGANSCVIDAVPAVGNTPAYLRVQVQGNVGEVTAWELHIACLEVTATGA